MASNEKKHQSKCETKDARLSIHPLLEKEHKCL
jgi:hypothetical protein